MTNMATYRIAGASDSCFCQRAKVRHLPPLLAVKQIKIFWRCCQKINVLYHAIAKKKTNIIENSKRTSKLFPQPNALDLRSEM